MCESKLVLSSSLCRSDTLGEGELCHSDTVFVWLFPHAGLSTGVSVGSTNGSCEEWIGLCSLLLELPT